MSNELELEKKIGDDDAAKEEPVKEDGKKVKGDDKAKKSAKAAPAKGKPKKSIVKYFKDARSEFKKVVWPSAKSVRNNTVVVIVALIVSAVFIWGVDSLLAMLNNLLLG